MFELRVADLTLRGIAQGGIETCLMVPQLRLMFDVGRSPLQAVSQRYSTILASHGHADHLGGLPYMLAVRAMMGLPAPTVYFPAEIERPLRTLLACWGEIEGFPLRVELRPTLPEQSFFVRKDLRVTALRSIHRVPSLAYVVERISHKLKDEFSGASGPEIAALRERGVDITREVAIPLLCVTGDTQIELFLAHDIVRRCRVLVHEVTAWDDRRDVAQTRSWGHTHVDELIAHAERFEGEALVLVHRSLRHPRSEAQAIVQARFPARVRDKVHVFGE